MTKAIPGNLRLKIAIQRTFPLKISFWSIQEAEEEEEGALRWGTMKRGIENRQEMKLISRNFENPFDGRYNEVQ